MSFAGVRLSVVCVFSPECSIKVYGQCSVSVTD